MLLNWFYLFTLFFHVRSRFRSDSPAEIPTHCFLWKCFHLEVNHGTAPTRSWRPCHWSPDLSLKVQCATFYEDLLASLPVLFHRTFHFYSSPEQTNYTLALDRDLHHLEMSFSWLVSGLQISPLSSVFRFAKRNMKQRPHMRKIKHTFCSLCFKIHESVTSRPAQRDEHTDIRSQRSI